MIKTEKLRELDRDNNDWILKVKHFIKTTYIGNEFFSLWQLLKTQNREVITVCKSSE